MILLVVLLTELHDHQIERLIRLDRRVTGVADWEELGESIFSGDPKGIQQVNYIKKRYQGGTPGTRFLDTLNVSKPNTTVADLIEVANELSRCDIAKGLSNVPPNILVAELEAHSCDVYHKLIAQLEYTGNNAIRNWEQFSEEYGFDPDLVNARTRKEGSQISDLIKLIISNFSLYSAKWSC